jgi:hypothetical protein
MSRSVAGSADGGIQQAPAEVSSGAQSAWGLIASGTGSVAEETKTGAIGPGGALSKISQVAASKRLALKDRARREWAYHIGDAGIAKLPPTDKIGPIRTIHRPATDAESSKVP